MNVKRFSASLAAAIVLSIAISAQTAVAKKSKAYEGLDTKLCPIGLIDFDDGDSFSCAGEKIRVLGIDAPEIKHPDHGIQQDQDGGTSAASATQRALKNAKRILIVRGGKDPYGRTLAHVIVDGELLGVKLIKSGYAYENVTHFGDNGMPEFALQILEASKSYPKPKFEPPWEWRKKNQKR